MESPTAALKNLANKSQHDIDGPSFPKFMDLRDPLRIFRDRFQFPLNKDLPLGVTWTEEDGEKPCIYLGGNSLGLKPKTADVAMKANMDAWGSIGLAMHFNGPLPAALCDQPGKAKTAEIVGAKTTDEVSICNGLSVNIHLLFSAFYRPEGRKNKIIIEDHAFPSDRYAMVSIIEQRDLNPDDVLIKLKPRPGEPTLRTEDILDFIRENADEIAIIFLSGIQYYTGQYFDMKSITRVGQEHGCLVGWDLAHAAGNVKLSLHDWNVDFACWCTYKYLNSGAGGIGGLFLHEKHFKNPPTSLKGWWSNKQETRFDMSEEVDPAIGADAFRLSNPPPWLACLNLASLDIFHEATMEKIVDKQFLLTGYLEYLLLKNFGPESSSEIKLEILTPSDPRERGSQLSLSFSTNIIAMYQQIKKKGIVCDFRNPNVIRVSPVPLYNSFGDIRKFVDILKNLVEQQQILSL